MMEMFYVAACIASLGAVGMGTTLGYSSPAVRSLCHGNATRNFTITTEEATGLGPLTTIGALLGALAAGFLADLLGRKKTLLFASSGFSSGWTVTQAARSVTALYIGRAITGFFTGIASLVVPLYVSEVSRPGVRGSLGSGVQLSVAIGIFAVHLAGKYVDWRVLASLCMIPTGLLGTLMFSMVESPRWLLMKGRREEAFDSLKFLYGKNIDQEAERRAIEEVITSSPEENFHLSELKQAWLYKPIVITIFLMFAQQFSGINAVMFYAVSIFEQAHTSIPSEDCMVIIGAMQVVATLVSTVVMGKGGRRVMLLLSTGLLGATLAVLGTYHYMEKARGDLTANIHWLPLVCLSVFIIGFSCGMGPIPWLMMCELLPVRGLGFASSLCTGCNWAFAFVVTKEFRSMVSVLDTHGTYWFFAGVMMVSFCVVLAFVPETKGKTLEQIEMAFRGIKVELDGAETAVSSCAESSCTHDPSDCEPSVADEPEALGNQEKPASTPVPKSDDDHHGQHEQHDASEACHV